MTRALFAPVLALLACSHAAPQEGAAPPRTKPRVLVVSGQNNHDWRWTTPSLAGILERSGRFEVDITYEPARAFVEGAGLGPYSAVVLDYNGERWGDEADRRFLAAVGEEHLGVVVVHAADNAFPGWVEYEQLVGDLWRDGTGHGSFHGFDIEVIDRDHPITRTLPTLIKHPDELYHRLVNTQNVPRRVLAHAYSAPNTGGTGEFEPMVIVKDWRGARVVHTPLGHVWTNSPGSQASHRDPQFQGLLVRCTEWAATGSVSDELVLPLGPSERAAGWEDVTDLARWQPRDPARTSRWRQEGDCIVLSAAGTGDSTNDLVSALEYTDFELEFEWKTTIAGNSGVKYRIPDGTGGIVAPEFQLLDAAAEVPPQHRAGALYDVYPCEAPPLAPWGTFNRARIVVRGDSVEHWLNGVRTVAAKLGDAEFEARRAASKFKDNAAFARAPRGRIALQDHSDEVWFRAVRVRDLSALGARAEDCLPTESLAGWRRVGDAEYTRVADELRGRFGPQQKQSFLVSEREFGDFVFEVELKFDALGNSGLQVRSHVNDGRLRGYQFEVDPSERSWSGGLYDEGRRGWLAGLGDDARARQAFVREDWNHYRIECVGPHLRAWVNGVQTCDHLDALDLVGSLAFQVHGGDPDIALRWRNARIIDLGRHVWRAHTGFVFAGEELVPGERHWLTAFDTAVGLAATVTGTAATLTIGDSELDLAQMKGWQAEGPNEVTLLRSGARVTVAVGLETVATIADARTAGPTGEAWCSVALTTGTGAEAKAWRELTRE